MLHDERLAEPYVSWTGRIIRNGMRSGYLAQELGEDVAECQVYEYFSGNPLFYDWTPGELAGLGRNFGFSADFFYSDQKIATLSGGEKVKLQLARVLMERPDFLLLDEPSNDVDLETLGWMEQFIRHTELPVLFISHDEYLLERAANSVIHLEQTMRKTDPAGLWPVFHTGSIWKNAFTVSRDRRNRPGMRNGSMKSSRRNSGKFSSLWNISRQRSAGRILPADGC